MLDDERQCVQRALGGDQAAFEALYAAHAGRARAYLLRSGFGDADADDLLQQVFVRAFGSLKTFDPSKGSFRYWLGAIARNVARRHWSRRRQPERFDPELAEEMFAGPGNPVAASQAREESAAVTDCVDALAAELAALVRMRYVDGLTTRAMAAASGMPEATVRLRLKEAMALLADCLREKGVLE